MKLPSTHHVIDCTSAGDPDVMRWIDTPLPLPAAGEVLIRVAAAGVNRADIMQRRGYYPPPAGASSVLGLEVSGTIVAVGTGVTRWRVADPVCALLEGGGYAEYAVAPAAQCFPVPDTVSLRDAAALPEAICTVWANIFDAGRLENHEALLVHGGASGIGTMAIQMAKAWGADIYVTVGDERKAVACRELGADGVINYHTQDFVEEVLALTAGRGVDVILDMVGGDYVNRNLRALASGGRHISIATQQARKAEIDLRLVMQRRLILTGSTLRAREKEEKAELIQSVEKVVWPWLAGNRVKPMVCKVFPINKAAEAHKMMESGEHIGKILLEVDI